MKKLKKLPIYLCLVSVLIIIVTVIFSIKSTWGMKKYYINGSKLSSVQINEVIDTFNIYLSDDEKIKQLSKFSYKNNINEYILEIKTNRSLDCFLDSNPYIESNFNNSQLKECYYKDSTVFIKVVETQSDNKENYILAIINLYEEIYEQINQ